MQQIIFFSFSLNCWLNRAYTNGLTPELNSTIVSTMATTIGLISRDGRFLKTYSIDSAPQQIPNMVLTVTTIRVTRFRVLMAACGREIRSLIVIKGTLSRLIYHILLCMVRSLLKTVFLLSCNSSEGKRISANKRKEIFSR